MPSTAYATNASPNFFLIVTSSMFQSFKVSKFQGTRRQPDFTLKPCNSETLKPSLHLVHRGGFEPPYLLRGTDLQSVGFNHSPTCANPKNTALRNNYTDITQPFSARETKCENSRLTYTRRKIDGLPSKKLKSLPQRCAANLRVAAPTSSVSGILCLELAKGIEPPTL
jgi:hypothetical protein